MRKTLLVLFVLGVLLMLGGGAAFAIPSLGGPTGIVSVPTAEVAPLNALEAALSYQTLKAGAVYQPVETLAMALRTNLLNAQQVYGGAGGGRGGFGPPEFGSERVKVWSLQGLAGISDQTEAWAEYAQAKDGDTTHLWGVGAKMRFPGTFLRGKTGSSTALAFGGSYQDWSDAGKVLKLYLTATEDLRTMRGAAGKMPPLLGTLGLMYLRVEPDEGDTQSTVRPFLGLEYVASKATTFGLEYRFRASDIDDKAVWSLLLRQQLDQSFSVEIGTTNASPVGTGMHDQGLFVRVGYAFPD